MDMLKKVYLSSIQRKGYKRIRKGIVPNKTKKILGIVIGILVVACISLYFMMISPAIKATNAYNKAVDEYNEMSTRYDEALKKSLCR